MLEGKVLDDRFMIVSRIGKGTFCTVYLATDQNTLKKAAVKVLNDGRQKQLFLKEISVLTGLNDAYGVPKYFGSGTMKGQHYIAMELLHCDMLYLFRMNSVIPIGTVMRIAKFTIRTLESIHKKGFLHLDIKPDNIALKRKDKSYSCCLIDYGMSVKYMLAGVHYNYKETGEFSGNPIFASVNMLLGRKPSRRDDLESLIYTLVLLANGSLPWARGANMSFGSLRAKMANEKAGISSAAICKGLPPEFGQILEHTRSLMFPDEPHYAHYLALLDQAGKRMNLDWEDDSEWTQLLAAESRPHQSKSDVSLRLLRSAKVRQQVFDSNADLPLFPEEVEVQEKQHRSTKKRLTKNLDLLQMIPRSKNRHIVVITKNPVLTPEELKDEENCETDPVVVETRSGDFSRKERPREATLVKTVAITESQRKILKNWKTGATQEV